MRKVGRRIAIVAALIIGPLIIFAIWGAAFAYGPFSATAQLVDRAAPLSSYPPLLVKTFVLIEEPDYFAESSRASLQSIACTLVEVCHGPRHLTAARLVARQATEAGLTRILAGLFATAAIESTQPKDQMLSAYLATSYLGEDHGKPVQGISEASNFYFSKHMTELTPSEIATIVGMFVSPSLFSPFSNPAEARERRAQILEQMKDAALISEDELHRSLDAPI
jgi:membrane carboxypeptidase/penicillin-binding protein